MCTLVTAIYYNIIKLKLNALERIYREQLGIEDNRSNLSDIQLLIRRSEVNVTLTFLSLLQHTPLKY